MPLNFFKLKFTWNAFKIKSYLSKFIRFVLPPTALAYFLGIRLFLRRTRKSYSQRGEDLIIDSFFRKSAVQELKVERGTYLDIGAWHPTAISNTALFSNKGWKGYAVDIDEYKLKFFGLQEVGLVKRF